MGHTGCGAIRAAVSHVKNHTPLPTPNIQTLINLIQPSVQQVMARTSNTSDEPRLVDACVRENGVTVSQNILDSSPLLNDLVKSDRFHIEKSVFEMETGRVVFI